MNETSLAYPPGEVILEGRTIELRPFGPADREAMIAFANAMPSHDLLFLQRDIRSSKVVDAWLDQIAQGWIHSLLALDGGRILGCTAMVRDELSWSPHVSEIRILVSPEFRGTGLGRFLALNCLERARATGVEKLCVMMTPDQTGARKLFEEMGFLPEALRREHIRDANGETYDLLVMALDVVQHLSRQQAYGLEN